MLSDTFCLVSYVILYHLDACCLMSSHVISFHLVPQCFFNICQCFPKSSDRWCQLISHCFLNVSSCLSLSHVVMSSLISLVWFVSCFLLHQLFFFSITYILHLQVYIFSNVSWKESLSAVTHVYRAVRQKLLLMFLQNNYLFSVYLLLFLTWRLSVRP